MSANKCVHNRSTCSNWYCRQKANKEAAASSSSTSSSDNFGQVGIDTSDGSLTFGSFSVDSDGQ